MISRKERYDFIVVITSGEAVLKYSILVYIWGTVTAHNFHPYTIPEKVLCRQLGLLYDPSNCKSLYIKIIMLGSL